MSLGPVLQKIAVRSTLCRGAVLALTVTLSTFAIAQTAPTPPKPGKLSPLNGTAHIAVRVQNIPASVAFYHKLGFDQAFANTAPDGTITQSFLKINDKQFIELYPVTPHETQIGFLHLCFEGADLNTLHDAYAAEGLAPISVRKAGAGNLLFTLKGPEQPAFPQNIEYTQYMPDSRHSLDAGKHLGPDRVADHMSVVSLAMKDPAAARAFYLAKLGFTADPANSTRLNIPGPSGQQIELVPATQLGVKSSIILTTPSLDKAAAQLTRQQVAFQRATSSATDASGKTLSKEMISVTDPDGNILRITSAE